MRPLQIFRKNFLKKFCARINKPSGNVGGTLRGRPALLGVYVTTLTAERIKEKKGQALIEGKGRLYTHTRTHEQRARAHARIRKGLKVYRRFSPHIHRGAHYCEEPTFPYKKILRANLKKLPKNT